MIYTFLLISLIFSFGTVQSESSSCENEICYPKYGNILIGRESKLSATSTCGTKGSEPFCEKDGESKMCSECNSNSSFRDQKYKYHAIENVVKSNTSDRSGYWWQSENGVEDVTIQLDLQSEMIVTNIMLFFRNTRPADMVIERSRNFGRSWYPWQYYSTNCAKSFPKVKEGDRVNISDVTCTSKYSKVVNESSGGLVFRVLPFGYSDAESSSGQVFNLLAATNLRIRFLKFHTFGLGYTNITDENRDLFYYSISKLYIRGTCSCYGHGNECIPEDGETVVEGKVYSRCNCVHNTEGPNCENCKSSHMNVLWKPAKITNPNPCIKCLCNGHSDHCHLDLMVLDNSNGTSGGMCHGCQHNTMGPHCEACLNGYYRNPSKAHDDAETCLPCDCDAVGSMGNGCNSSDGQCDCKPGRSGRKCDTDRNIA